MARAWPMHTPFRACAHLVHALYTPYAHPDSHQDGQNKYQDGKDGNYEGQDSHQESQETLELHSGKIKKHYKAFFKIIMRHSGHIQILHSANIN